MIIISTMMDIVMNMRAASSRQNKHGKQYSRNHFESLSPWIGQLNTVAGTSAICEPFNKVSRCRTLMESKPKASVIDVTPFLLEHMN